MPFNFFFLLLKIILFHMMKGIERESLEWVMSSLCWFSLWMVVTTRSRPGQSQESGTPSGSLPWVARSALLQPSPAASQEVHQQETERVRAWPRCSDVECECPCSILTVVQNTHLQSSFPLPQPPRSCIFRKVFQMYTMKNNAWILKFTHIF